MGETLKERGIEGDYVCKPCELIYCVYGDRRRCDICNRKLKFIRAEELKELERKWEKEKKTRRISFMVKGKPREGEPKPRARRVSFISRR